MFIIRTFFVFDVSVFSTNLVEEIFCCEEIRGEEGGEKEKEMEEGRIEEGGEREKEEEDEEGRWEVVAIVEVSSAGSIRCSAMLFVPIRLSVIMNKGKKHRGERRKKRKKERKREAK